VPVVPPEPPPPVLKVSPATVADTDCSGKTYSFIATGGTGRYGVTVTPSPAAPGGQVPGNSFTITVAGLSATGIYSVVVYDQGSPKQTVTATITCAVVTPP
jgi:hypothetical protein